MNSEGAFVQIPDQAKQHLDRARACAEKGEYEPALLECESALQLAPEWAEAHDLRSEVLSKLGRDEEAMAAFLEATHLDPSLLEYQKKQLEEEAEVSVDETEATLTAFKCEQCGREGPEAIFTCSERPLGRCPYVEERREKTPLLSSLLVGVLLLLVAAVLVLVEPSTLWVGLGLAGLGILLLGATFLLHAFRTQTVGLYHADSGIRLERTTVRGRQLSYAWTSPVEPLPLELELPRPLVHPPSIVALPEEWRNVSTDEAVAIIRSTLIAMLAQGYIQVRRSQTHRFKGKGLALPVHDVFTLVGTQPSWKIQLNGKLEREIGRIVGAIPQLDGRHIHNVVHALYFEDQANPERWLAERVADDAAGRGMGHKKRRKLELDAAFINEIQEEREILEELWEQLSRDYPSFASALDAEIAAGIASRKADRGC